MTRARGPGRITILPMRFCSVLVLVFARLSLAQDDDLANAFGPQKEARVFEPEHNVPPPPVPDDANAALRVSFESDFAEAKKKLESGDTAGAKDAVALLELSAFVLGGTERVKVQHLARGVAVAMNDRKSIAAIDEKWLVACGPNDVDACREAALGEWTAYNPERVERVRAADACLKSAEQSAGKKAPACLSLAQALYRQMEDTLMLARVDLVNALAMGKAGKKALTKIGETIDGRNGHVRQLAYEARAKLELAEGKTADAAKSALLGADARGTTMAPERRYWARSAVVDQMCEAYDREKGRDACRQLEKSVVGFYVFHDFSDEHLADRQVLSHEMLVKVNEHYGVLIRDCLAAEIQKIADKDASSYLVYWLVNGNGHVDNFHSVSSDLDQSRFVRCLREQFGYWRYPTHEAAPQRIQQGFSVKSRMRVSEETEITE